jgi:hypothetical protein
MIDLNSIVWNGGDWLLWEAEAVNDTGQIVGEGALNGELHAFSCSPCPGRRTSFPVLFSFNPAITEVRNVLWSQ